MEKYLSKRGINSGRFLKKNFRRIKFFKGENLCFLFVIISVRILEVEVDEVELFSFL